MTITKENKTLKPERNIIIKKEITIPADFSDPYLDIDFSVPKHAKKVGVVSSHVRKKSFPWIYISIFDPFNFRRSSEVHGPES